MQPSYTNQKKWQLFGIQINMLRWGGEQQELWNPIYLIKKVKTLLSCERLASAGSQLQGNNSLEDCVNFETATAVCPELLPIHYRDRAKTDHGSGTAAASYNMYHLIIKSFMAESGVFEQGNPPGVFNTPSITRQSGFSVSVRIVVVRDYVYWSGIKMNEGSIWVGLSQVALNSIAICNSFGIWSALLESLNKSLPLCWGNTCRENVLQKQTDTNSKNEAFAPASHFVSLQAIIHKTNLVKEVMKISLCGRGLTRESLWQSHYTLFFNNPFPLKFHKPEQVLLQQMLYFFIMWQ